MKFRSVFIKPNSSPIPDLSCALAYWEEKRGKRIAPAWRDVSLMDLNLKIVPFTNVVDIEPDTLKTRYRFWGTDLSNIFGGDFTNKSPMDIPAAGIGRNATSGYEKLVQEKVPNCEMREFILQSGIPASQIVLRLPLSDDGISINHSINIHFHEIKGSNDPISTFFEKCLKA